MLTLTNKDVEDSHSGTENNNTTKILHNQNSGNQVGDSSCESTESENPLICEQCEDGTDGDMSPMPESEEVVTMSTESPQGHSHHHSHRVAGSSKHSHLQHHRQTSILSGKRSAPPGSFIWLFRPCLVGSCVL